jgi:hypothetical protein
MKKGAEFWEAHVASARLEGVPSNDYARRHGLSVSALYYWQRKLRKVGDGGAVVQSGKFVALHLSATGSHRNDCNLVLPSGLRLEMSALPEPEWLAALGRATQGAR